ncbi:MAG: hypothetical protein U0905_22120 [Pirellulales bacterium]
MRVIPEEHLQFFQEMYDFYETDQHFFVHANYDPELPLEDQSDHMLRWLKLTESVPGPHFIGNAILGHTHGSRRRNLQPCSPYPYRYLLLWRRLVGRV